MRDVFEVEDSPGAADEEGSVPNPLAASQDASRTQLVAALAALGGGGDGRDAEAAVDLLASYFDLEAGRSSSRRGPLPHYCTLFSHVYEPAQCSSDQSQSA